MSPACVSHHYSDAIMGVMASQISSLPIVLLNRLFSGDQTKHQNYASLAFVRGIQRWPVNSPHKWPVTRKMFPFDDVIMTQTAIWVDPTLAQCRHCRPDVEPASAQLIDVWQKNYIFCRFSIYHGPIQHGIVYNTTTTRVEWHCSVIELIKDTTYLALMDELWDVYWQDFMRKLAVL